MYSWNFGKGRDDIFMEIALVWCVPLVFSYLAETRLQQDQLSTTKCSLDTVQEEIQMVKLSLSEKETELLQAQDQLL